MGTNYYLHENICKYCGRSDKPLHIGKSSAGWHFMLHVIPQYDIHSLDDWRNRFLQWGGQIRSENGEKISIEKMITIISERRWDRPYGTDHIEQLRQNGEPVEHGFNGLARMPIDGEHCVGHGPGTWDLIAGDFS
jgi:hypothetical protein